MKLCTSTSTTHRCIQNKIMISTMHCCLCWHCVIICTHTTQHTYRVANNTEPKYGTLLLSLPSPFLSFPSPPFLLPFPLPFPSLPLEVGPYKGVWGSTVSSPAGSGAEPQPKSNFVHFSFKIWHLVAANLMIFLRLKLPNSVQFKHHWDTSCSL